MQRAYHEHVERFEQLLLDLPEEALEPPPAGIRTSVTGLVTYARCPQRFYWSEVDRLPRRHSPAARRGVDVHRRIELHHRGVMLLEDVVPEAYDLPEDHLAAGDGGHPGGIDPFQVFAASRFASTRPFLVEAPFELRVGGDVTVRGRIDAVYRSDGGAWEVVDFKSGRPTADRAARVQLEAYAVAVDRVAMAAERPTSLTVTFAHLGGGRLAEVSEVVDDSWLSQADERLTELAEGIEAGSFDPTPSPACHRCDFLRFCPAGRAFTRAQSA